MAKGNKKTEKVAASKDAAATPVENVQETIADIKATEETNATVTGETVTVENFIPVTDAEADADLSAKAKSDEEAEAIARAEADLNAKANSDEEAEAKGRLESEKGYGFTADAPKHIRYNGEIYSQEEVLNNAELLHELVRGKCGFIKRV